MTKQLTCSLVLDILLKRRFKYISWVCCQICTGTVANSWRTSTEINKSGSAAKERDLVEQVRDLKILALFRMDFFGAAHGWVEGQTPASSLKSVTHIQQRWNLAQFYLDQRRSKQYTNHVTHPLSYADISIFYRKSANFAISRNTDMDCILIHNFYLF